MILELYTLHFIFQNWRLNPNLVPACATALDPQQTCKKPVPLYCSLKVLSLANKNLRSESQNLPI